MGGVCAPLEGFFNVHGSNMETLLETSVLMMTVVMLKLREMRETSIQPKPEFRYLSSSFPLQKGPHLFANDEIYLILEVLSTPPSPGAMGG